MRRRADHGKWLEWRSPSQDYGQPINQVSLLVCDRNSTGAMNHMDSQHTQPTEHFIIVIRKEAKQEDKVGTVGGQEQQFVEKLKPQKIHFQWTTYFRPETSFEEIHQPGIADILKQR